MKYKDIIEDVLSGKFARHSKNRDWVMMDEYGNWINEHGKSVIISRTLLSLDTWEVKLEPEEIYVWGKTFWIDGKPENLISEKNEFPADNVLQINGKGGAVSFGEDKPRKYKLIPVDEEPEFSKYSPDGKMVKMIPMEYFENGRKEMWKEIKNRVMTHGLYCYGSVIKYIIEGSEPE